MKLLSKSINPPVTRLNQNRVFVMRFKKALNIYI